MLNNTHRHDALTAKEWEGLQSLGARVGVSTSGIELMRQRALAGESPQEGSCVLLAGRPKGALDLLLARWFSPETAEALANAGASPLVIGPAPHTVQPALGAWPTLKSPVLKDVHWIALNANGAPSPAMMGQLATVRGLDQLVLVTRLGQPLHPKERELAQALSSYLPTVRVVAVAVPGEEPTDDDLAAFAALAQTLMRDAGFRAGRCLAAGVWYTEAAARRPGTIQDLNQFLAVDRAAVAEARLPMMRGRLCGFLREVRQAAASQEGPKALPVSEADARMLSEKLQVYLANLGRDLTRIAQTPRIFDDQSLQSWFLDRLRSWGAYVEPEGMWLKHAETLRPGTQAALLAEATSQAPRLTYKSFENAAPANAGSASNSGLPADAQPLIERALLEAKRLGIGLALGVVASVLVDQLNMPLARLLSYVSLILGTVLGYGVARQFLRGPKGLTSPETFALAALPASSPSAADEWLIVERHLLAWFQPWINTRLAEPLEECQRFAERLGCERSES